MPRYVILRHEPEQCSSGSLHWDLMLEVGDVLWTWACDEDPTASDSFAAERLADHRRAYLEYQGPVSGQRGSVSRCDAGVYTLEQDSAGQLVVLLRGEKLHSAQLILRPRHGSSQRWDVKVVAG